MNETNRWYSVCILVGLVLLGTSQATALFTYSLCTLQITNRSNEIKALRNSRSFKICHSTESYLICTLPSRPVLTDTEVRALELDWSQIPWTSFSAGNITILSDQSSCSHCTGITESCSSSPSNTMGDHNLHNNKTQSSYICTARPCISSCIYKYLHTYIYEIFYIYSNSRQQFFHPSLQSQTQIKLTSSYFTYSPSHQSCQGQQASTV